MQEFPSLTTERLILRAFTLEDAPRVMELAGEWEIAETTANIPHPYEPGMAKAWINTHADQFQDHEGATFAITLETSGLLVGAVGFHINPPHRWAEMGYWIGVPYWNQGYATEAASAVLDFGFENYDLNRFQARHMTKNPASGRVLQKIGMTCEGTLRESIFRWDRFEDIALYAILRSEHGVD